MNLDAEGENKRFIWTLGDCTAVRWEWVSLARADGDIGGRAENAVAVCGQRCRVLLAVVHDRLSVSGAGDTLEGDECGGSTRRFGPRGDCLRVYRRPAECNCQRESTGSTTVIVPEVGSSLVNEKGL